jgi:hypothetical protein
VEDRGDVLSIVEMENLQEDIKARRKWVVHRRQIANTLVDTHSVATPEELQLLEYINSKKQRRRSSYDVGRLVAEVNSDSLIVIKQAIRNKGMTLQAALLLGLIDFLELKLSLEDLTPSYKINSEGRSNDVRSHSLST